MLNNRIPELLDIKVNGSGLDNLSAAAMMQSSLDPGYSDLGDIEYSDPSLLKDLEERVKKECKA